MLPLLDWKGIITSVLLLWNSYLGLPVWVGYLSISADVDYCTATFSAFCVQGTGWDFGILKRWKSFLFVCFLKGNVSEAVGALIRLHLWPEIMNYSSAIDEAKKELPRETW